MDAINRISDEALMVSERQRLKLETIENNYIKAKDELVEENHRLAKLIENKYELIENYSKFKDVFSLMSILADITTLFMGREYYYDKNDGYPILIPKELDNNEQIIFFEDEYNISDDTLQFYKYDGDVDGELFQFTLYESENLEKYDFLKRFIDYLINYKFEVSKCNLLYDVLKKLEKEFILMNSEEIMRKNKEPKMLFETLHNPSAKTMRKLLEKHNETNEK